MTRSLCTSARVCLLLFFLAWPCIVPATVRIGNKALRTPTHLHRQAFQGRMSIRQFNQDMKRARPKTFPGSNFALQRLAKKKMIPQIKHIEPCNQTQHGVTAKTGLPPGATMLYNTSITADREDLLVYMHIPKCGGSQFLGAVAQSTRAKGLRWFPSTIFGDTHDHHSYNSPGCGPLKQMHCGFNEIDSCIEAGLSHQQVSKCGRLYYSVLLRDPVSRSISEFYWGRDNWCKEGKTHHIQNWPKDLCRVANEDRVHNMAKNHQFSEQIFKKWLLNQDNIGRNRQVKHIVATVKSPSELHEVQCLHMDQRRNLKYWHERYPPKNGKGSEDLINEDMSLVDEALQILKERFWFVGFTEDFKGSVNCFKNLAKTAGSRGVHNNAASHGSGAAKVSQLIPESIRTLLRSYNALDVALHDKVLALYQKACRSDGGLLGALSTGVETMARQGYRSFQSNPTITREMIEAKMIDPGQQGRPGPRGR